MNKKIPSLSELEKVSNKIKDIPNKRGEWKRKVHYGCYLLCSQSGLRITEAIKLDLSTKTKKDLYLINKPKRQKERYVYIPKEVIRELKNNNWQPNQTNRFAFYHFLKKVKKELNIGKNTELTPHTLRHAFTTYHAEAGMPLPLLQKLLGHASIRTTALYWQNIHGNNNDTADILAGKKWLEKCKLSQRQKPSQKRKPPEPTNTENFALPKVDAFSEQLPKNLEPPINRNKSIITEKKPTIKDNLPLPIFIEPKPVIINRKFPLKIIDKTEPQISISEPLKPIIHKTEPKIEKELILLAKIKSLEEQLRKTETERDNLKIEKEKAEVIAEQEQERADHYGKQLKIIAKAFSQWQKINYYQQLEQETQAQIIQTPPSK